MSSVLRYLVIAENEMLGIHPWFFLIFWDFTVRLVNRLKGVRWSEMYIQTNREDHIHATNQANMVSIHLSSWTIWWKKRFPGLETILDGSLSIKRSRFSMSYRLISEFVWKLMQDKWSNGLDFCGELHIHPLRDIQRLQNNLALTFTNTVWQTWLSPQRWKSLQQREFLN